ncbi:High-affinity branched-chain amino acid transport system permease protein LivH [subsurface metagenome]
MAERINSNDKTKTRKPAKKRVFGKLKTRTSAWVVIVVTIGLAIVIGKVGGAAQVANAVVSGGMWALLAVGLALILGVMNIPNFSHGESFMVGAYVAYFVFSPLYKYNLVSGSKFLFIVGPFIGFIAAALAGFILGIIIERLIFSPLRKRTRERWVMNAFLLTVGISFILTNGTNLVIGPNFRGIPRYWDVAPFSFLGVRLTVDRIVAFTIAVVSIAALWFFLRRTKTGRAIRAVSQDESGADMVGINIRFIHTLTFGLGTSMASVAGACLLFMFQAYPTVGLKPLYFAWYVVMLVGLGNVSGAIVGGFIVAFLQTGTQQFIGVAWEEVVPTIVMMLVLIVAPSGIFGSEVKGIQEQ